MWAVLLGTPVSQWTVFSIVCVTLCALWFPKASASSEQPVQTQLFRCPYTSSPDPEQHETFVEQLNGTRILFIGDSVTRLQYITLASFLANGLCPDEESESRKLEYALLFSMKDQDYIYRESSRVLNTPHSVESCFCLQGHREPETRSFTYEDEKGRRVQLEYMSYTDERMRPLRFYMQTAMNMRPTHVVINFGLKLLRTNADCGEHDRDRMCPYLPKVCEFLTEEQPFRVIWQTSTPRLREVNATMGTIGTDHHLHIPQRCKLDPSSVLNRVEILHALEPDQMERRKLYHDTMHFSPAPYHAFNGVLMEMITRGDAGHVSQAVEEQQQALINQ